MSKWIMLLGGGLLLVGIILHFAPWLLSWFGKLPGDIRVESERAKVFIPITSMILISLVVTLILNILKNK